MYIVSIQNDAQRDFHNLANAVKYMKGKIYVADDLDFIHGTIETQGVYRAVYGFQYGEIYWENPLGTLRD